MKAYINTYFYDYAKELKDGDYCFSFSSDDKYPYEQIKAVYKDQFNDIRPHGKSAFLLVSSHSVGYIKDELNIEIKSNLNYITYMMARAFKYDFSHCELINSVACANSMLGIKRAITLLNNGFDSVLLMGCNFVSPKTKKLFKELGIKTSLCEGVAIFLLDKRVSKSSILNAGLICDINTTSALTLCKDSYKSIFKMALNGDEIDGVKAHFSTQINNNIELDAIKEVFGDDIKITHYKDKIGHTLDASGLIEFGLFLDDDYNGRWVFSSSGFGGNYGFFTIQVKK